MDYYKMALDMHAKNRGKITVESKVPLKTTDDLSIAYTPGVAQPCLEIAENPEAAWTYTTKSNMVAVITNGSAILGLGNIGAPAGMPVMEGKCILFKQFGGVDAFPIGIEASAPEEVIAHTKAISCGFGGINLEDIGAPQCFEIEQVLERELDIPVFHDDQHGTAVVCTAAIINALEVVGKRLEDIKIVLNGPGSAGTAIIYMLLEAGAKNIIAVDRTGTIYEGRPDGLPAQKAGLAKVTNKERVVGGLKEAIVGADLFIGTSAAGALTQDMVRSMNDKAIVFAMANPTPEIPYEEALEAGAAVVGTGRSDNPNQVNNVLCFPGLFKGALQVRARDITPNMKIAAAHAIAHVIPREELRPDYVIPSALNPLVGISVARAVAEAAIKDGTARYPEGINEPFEGIE